MDEGHIELGDLVRDKISGYEGIVIAETRWLNMCTRYTLQARGTGEKGKPIDSQTFDENDCVLKAKDPLGYFRSESEPANGGPAPEPVRTR